MSAYWPRPTWQNGIAPTIGGRLVPDISLDANPSSGLDIRAQGSWFQVGGTSLAAPLAAATMTDLQIADGPHGRYGLGNIAQNLYRAPRSSFRDTTLGTNGYFPAGPGYDLATGLGAPLWSRLDPAILGAPILSVPPTTTSFVIPLAVTVPVGMIYTGFRGGVGTTTEPTTCNASGAPSSPPTSELATQVGPTVVWVMAYDPSGHCYLSDAPVIVGPVGNAPSGFDFTGDGKADLLAVKSNGDLMLYPGNGASGFTGPGTRIGTGWATFTNAL